MTLGSELFIPLQVSTNLPRTNSTLPFSSSVLVDEHDLSFHPGGTINFSWLYVTDPELHSGFVGYLCYVLLPTYQHTITAFYNILSSSSLQNSFRFPIHLVQRTHPGHVGYQVNILLMVSTSKTNVIFTTTKQQLSLSKLSCPKIATPAVCTNCDFTYLPTYHLFSSVYQVKAVLFLHHPSSPREHSSSNVVCWCTDVTYVPLAVSHNSLSSS